MDEVTDVVVRFRFSWWRKAWFYFALEMLEGAVLMQLVDPRLVTLWALQLSDWFIRTAPIMWEEERDIPLNS